MTIKRLLAWARPRWQVTYVTVPHPVEACYGSYRHCSVHAVDEAPRGYRVCFECGHTYATAEELLAEHNRVLASLNREVDPAGDPLWVSTVPIPPETDAARVFCCPFCAHDW